VIAQQGKCMFEVGQRCFWPVNVVFSRCSDQWTAQLYRPLSEVSAGMLFAYI